MVLRLGAFLNMPFVFCAVGGGDFAPDSPSAVPIHSGPKQPGDNPRFNVRGS